MRKLIIMIFLVLALTACASDHMATMRANPVLSALTIGMGAIPLP